MFESVWITHPAAGYSENRIWLFKKSFTLSAKPEHAPLNISADELMERFVRGDASRNTEGSGLGLSIARSLTELNGGTLELTVDGDLFKATLIF